MARTRIRKKPMSEINVVPYIDVMLVLLVIFMITAPLLSQGINVDLPQAPSNPIESKQKDPLVLSINRDGDFFLNVGEKPDKPIESSVLIKRVAAVLKHQPGTPVLIRGDKQVDYGRVVIAMALLQQAGAPSIGMLTDPPPAKRR